MKLKDRYTGSLIGLAVGDALGAPVEFLARGTFPKITEYQEGGRFNLQIGEYTDDTAMMLCLAQSLIEKSGMDQKDQLSKYLNWYQQGYMSATGRSIGCGKNTLGSLYRFMSKNCSECGNKKMKKMAGNGSIMHLAPVALFYADNLKLAMEMSAKSSYTTHGLAICADASMVLSGLIIGAVNGKSKEELLSCSYAKELFDCLDNYTFHEEVERVIEGSYKDKSRDQISSSGYVINTLESALWAFYHTNSFEEGLILVVNLGHDSDTVGAVYGQLAGSYYGIEAIPERFKRNLMNYDLIEKMALELKINSAEH